METTEYPYRKYVFIHLFSSSMARTQSGSCDRAEMRQIFLISGLHLHPCAECSTMQDTGNVNSAPAGSAST